MGDSKKLKKKCCHKFEKKGNCCSSCPLIGQVEGKKIKREEKGKKKVKKGGK